MIEYMLLADRFGLKSLANQWHTDLIVSWQDGFESHMRPALVMLCTMPTIPPILLPIIPAALECFDASIIDNKHEVMCKLALKVYGDLEEVWGSDDLERQRGLVQLVPTAIKLLLSADELKVAAEETVMYTAIAWTRYQVEDSIYMERNDPFFRELLETVNACRINCHGCVSISSIIEWH